TGRRTKRVDGAPSRANQRSGDPALSEQADGAVDRVTFGDASQIQLDAGVVEANRLRSLVQNHMLGADVTTCRRELLRGRYPPVAAKEAPCLHQRTDRDVEGAAGVPVVSHRVRDEVEQLRLDGYG